MDYKKTNAPTNTVTRNLVDLSKDNCKAFKSDICHYEGGVIKKIARVWDLQ